MISEGLPAGQERVFRLFDQIADELSSTEPLPEGTPVLIDALGRYGAEIAFDRMSVDEGRGRILRRGRARVPVSNCSGRN